MSSPLDIDLNPDEPSSYAPRWARHVARRERRDPSREFDDRLDADDLLSSAAETPLSDEGLVIDRIRVPRSLDPTVVPEPWPAPRRRRRSHFGMFVRLAFAVAVATIAAFFAVGKLPPAWTSVTEHAEDAMSFGSRFLGQASSTPERAIRAAPSLVVEQAVPHPSGEAFPLGVSVHGAADGVVLVIRGLANGASLSTGRASADNAWHLVPTDLDRAMIRPSQDFVGAMDLSVELRLADETVADRRTLRFEWAAPTPSPESKRQPVRQLDPEEIASLLKRGEEFIASGDLAAARLVLQRAAEAGNARSALVLAGTYDPIVLEKLGEQRFAPDIALARIWYEKAKQFGSPEAPRRLEMLASRDH